MVDKDQAKKAAAEGAAKVKRTCKTSGAGKSASAAADKASAVLKTAAKAPKPKV